jgi:hypothetical protein
MRVRGYIGLIIYAILYTGLTAALVRASYLSTRGEQHKIQKLLGLLGFLGDKFETELFYWEAVIIARKLGLMVAFFLFDAEDALLIGTAVVAVALVSHVAVGPYEDDTTDSAEFATLVAQLLLLVAAPVFKVINDPEDPSTAANASLIKKWLESASVGVIVMTSIYGVYAAIKVHFDQVRLGHESISMLRVLQLTVDDHRRKHEGSSSEIAHEIIVGNRQGKDFRLISSVDYKFELDRIQHELGKN